MNEATGLAATEAAVGIVLARAGELPVAMLGGRWGMTRTAVESRRLVLGAAVEVSTRRGLD